MPKINVVEAFTLNTPKGPKRFELGEQEASKEEAEHWYTQCHVQKPKAKKAGGSGQAGDDDKTGEGGDDKK